MPPVSGTGCHGMLICDAMVIRTTAHPIRIASRVIAWARSLDCGKTASSRVPWSEEVLLVEMVPRFPVSSRRSLSSRDESRRGGGASLAPMHAVVLGTGSMAPEIAAALAVAGGPVVVCGRSRERADAAARRAHGAGRRRADDHGRRPGRSAPSPAPALVVETVAEDLALKRELLARIEAWSPPEAILATNTSSLRIADIAAALARPGALRRPALPQAGPPDRGGGGGARPADRPGRRRRRWRRRAEAMGKAPLVVRADVPGFIWNRIQFAVLRECLHMLEAGVADAADIDAAVSDGLAPRWMAAGPLATADLGGLAVFATISAQLFPHLADGHAAPAELTERAAEGRPFAPWTAGGGEAVAALRARALAMGREIAARRRDLGA